MREIELKLLLDEAGEARLRAALTASDADGAEIEATNLHATYFDTAERALAAQGVAIRLRKEGRRWVQTVKARADLIAGLSTPLESECPAPGGRLDLDAIPDEALRARLLGIADPEALSPVCETVIRRETRRRAGPHGGEVEIALDVGEIRANGFSAHIREAEIELKSGDPRDVYAVARGLFTEGPIRFSRRSKSERGYALAEGRPAIEETPQPALARPVRLRGDMTTEQAAAAVLRGCLDQIAGNIAAAAASNAPEAPHQLRVGLRRLRTAAAVFGDMLGGPELERIETEAKILADAVGGLRDLDVLADQRLGPRAKDDPRLAPLAAALGDRRDAARPEMRARLAAPETAALAFDLGAFVEGRGWLRRSDYSQTAALARPIGETARKALDRRWEKAARLGARIDDLRGEARHDLRKALKKLRYTMEFFESLWSAKRVKPFLSRLKKLQDDFGALQDLAMAEAVLGAEDAPGARDPDARFAAGLALGRWEAEAERDWARAKAHWAALADERKFWR